jgi:hypothetical protein
MKQTEILDQITGVQVMDPEGVVYRVTGYKQVHEMFEPYIQLTRQTDNKVVYVALNAYAEMCDIADNATLPVR